MRLSTEQLKAFDERGYVSSPIVSPRTRSRCCAQRPRMSSSSTARKCGARRLAHRAPPLPPILSARCFGLLARHPRLVEPLRAAVWREDVYVHQFKLNAKAAFEGEVWQWHQDYGTWARDDGMPRAACHEHRRLSRRGDADQRAAVSNSEESQAGRPGRRPRQADDIIPVMDSRQGDGDATCVNRSRRWKWASSPRPANLARCSMFHGNLVHASPPNITPYPRKIVYLTLCAVSNHITKFTRAEWIAHRDVHAD